MLKIILLLVSIFSTSLTHAQAITSCKNPEGYAYFHYSGQVSKADSGFNKDKITGGMVTRFINRFSQNCESMCIIKNKIPATPRRANFRICSN